MSFLYLVEAESGFYRSCKGGPRSEIKRTDRACRRETILRRKSWDKLKMKDLQKSKERLYCMLFRQISQMFI